MSGEQRTVIKGNNSKYVKLNVGGYLYYTTIGTLTKQDTLLQAMFSGRMEVLTDSEGWILIDRNGTHFGKVLDYLRDSEVSLNLSRSDLEQFLAEAKFYLVQNLVEQIQKEIQRLDKQDQSLDKQDLLRCIPEVPIVTSSIQEQALISHSKIPVIKFIFNRQNNKYSYTSNSDEHMLKNLEKFDKLSLQFNNRILFIKSVYCSQEICCWYFYHGGVKSGEVCCTSIVYGTDKKHTKIDFPEARIFEETLNLLSLENNAKGVDSELMRVLKGHPPSGPGHHSDEEEERHDRHDKLRRK